MNNNDNTTYLQRLTKTISKKKQTVLVLMVALILIGTAYLTIQSRSEPDTVADVLALQKELTTIKNELLGYTKYTDYLLAGKKVLTGKMMLLTAKVVRPDVRVQHIQTYKLGIPFEATVIVKYSTEYSFGYDLNPDKFEIIGTASGIQIKLNKPILVSSPAVTPVSYEIPSGSIIVDEKGEIIKIHQKLPAITLGYGKAMASDAAVQALCEKKLVEFLHDFLAKQPGVTQVPAISVAYL